MAIGRHKSRSRGMTIITIIFLLVSLRLIWLSAQSMSAGSAREDSRYPLENAGLRIPDTRIVTKQELIINQLDRDLDAKIAEKVMRIKDREYFGVPTFSDAEKLFVQVENIQNNVDIKSGSDRRVVIHEDIAVRDSDAHITKAPTTIKPTSSPTVVTNRENSAEQSNTVIDLRDIQVKPTHNVTLTSKSPRTIIVHTNDDNVVEFTKEQLDYGNFIDNEEEKRNNHTMAPRKVEQDNATVTAENLTERSNQTITIKNNDNVEENIARQETITSTTDNSTDNVKQEDTTEINTLQTEETNQTTSIKSNNNVGEGVVIKEKKNSTMIHTDNVKQENTKVISTLPTKETNQTTTMKSNGNVEEDIVINKQYNKPSSVIIKDDLGHCQRIIPWGQPNHVLISTFYLPSRGNYTIIDDNGNYPIPVKTVAEVTDPKVIEPVTVILVPFSHADPGYGLTIEQYYTTKTKSTLDNMITKLNQYPDMTFQWAETVYLARWFTDLTDDKKKQVRELISRGQLEIVLGGWVMPDEASTRYVGVIDQLIEGHQWLLENLGVKPKTAWVNDPFGYSSTMPYLWKSSGLDNLLFLRINQAVKAQLMEMKAMDFMWRPYWKTENSSDVLSSLMAYTNYFISDVCSPDMYRDACYEFGFIHLDKKKHRAIEITDENLAIQAEKLHGLLRVTADLYKYNTLYIGLGEDFSFTREAEWDNLYKNYEKLIKYINTKPEWKMKIKFGSLTEYFNNVRSQEHEMVIKTPENGTKKQIPTLSGDFFPYTEKNNEYWTGYYSTRPLNKRFSRELETLIHTADAYNVMLYSIFKYYNMKYEAYSNVAENLRIARRELGMFLHHDGITGTSLPHVVRDFELRLMKAYESVQTAFKTVITTMLTKGRTTIPKLLQEETVKTGPRQISKKLVFQVGRDANKLVVINPIGRKRAEFVSVYVNSSNIEVKSHTHGNVYHQTTILNDSASPGRVMVTFQAILPAFGMEVYRIVPTNEPAVQTLVREVNVKDGTKTENETFVIENPAMKVVFDKKTGMLREIRYPDGNITHVTSGFYTYNSVHGGAYIFGRNGSAVLFSPGKAGVTVTRGQLKSEVKVKAPGFVFSVTIYNTTELQGHGIHIRTEVDMKSLGLQNKDLIFRLSTSTKNGPYFFTDQNGYQMMGRHTDKTRKIEANYYPITTMATLEDKHKRVTLHCKQPHGAASLEEGQLEVMLDRHTYRDDGRGLGQGVYDNVNVNSDFILHVEYKDVKSELEEVRYTYPTQDAVLMNDALQNNIFIYSVVDNNVKISDKVYPLKDRQLPCDVTLVSLRNLVKNNLEYYGTSLVLHRHSFKCGYQPKSDKCTQNDNKLTIRNLLPKVRVKVTETTLSHLHVIKELDMDTDLKPKHMELRSFKIDI